MKGKVRRKGWISVLLLGVLLLLPACSGKRTEVQEGSEYIYALNDDMTGLAKITFQLPEGDTQEVAEAILEELAKPSEDIDYSQTIPESVSVQNCTIEDAIASIDFNDEYREISQLEEKLLRAAVVRSLLKVDGISGVYFTIDGEQLKDNQGNVVGLMTEDDFVDSTDPLSSYETGTLTLYFANKTGDRLITQTMDVKYNSNISKEKLIVEKLMKGPKKSGAYPTLNPNASLLGVAVKDGICYVNFDSEFLNSAYDVKPEIVVYSLVNSLVEGTGAGKVQIMVNGEKSVTYKETIDLSQPMQSNMELAGDVESKKETEEE